MAAPGPGACADVGDDPEVVRVWESECATAFEPTFPDSGPTHVHHRFDRVRSGEASMALWRDPYGSPGGFVLWEPVPDVGRRVVLWYLDRAHQDRGSLAELLASFESSEPLRGPVFVAPDAIPGLPLDDQAAVLETADWLHFDELTLVVPAAAEVPAAVLGRDWTFRPLKPEDRDALLTLGARAYHDYPGQLRWPRVDLERDLASYHDQLGSERHPVIAEATSVAVVGDTVRGYIVTSRDVRGPVVDSLQVDPSWQGRGLGRALLVRALQTLHDAGNREDVSLVVLRQNVRAVALYRSVGFQPASYAKYVERGYWVRRRTLRAVLDRAATAKYR